jgi:glutamate--cysteine ligase
LHEMRTNHESFFNFALRMSKVHQSYFRELLSPNPSRQDEFAAEAAASIEQQAHIEASDTIGFDDYLARYFAA